MVKRTPKEAPIQKFSQDDIQELKSTSDIPFEWGPDFVGSDGYAMLPPSTSTSNEPAVANSPGSVPKTFKAETVGPSENGEIVRKLSSVSAEFRPISESLTKQSPPSGSKLTQQGSVEVVTTPEDGPEDVSKSSSVNKRRRRKRSVMKKKGSSAATPQRKNSEAGEASDTSASIVWESASSILSNAAKSNCEVAVFAMDDFDSPQVC